MNRNFASVFVRFPEPGRTKTRLIPALGEIGATFFYRHLAEHCVNQILSSTATCIVNISPKEKVAETKRWLGPKCKYEIQPEGDLGEKLNFSFLSAFDNHNAQRVIAIGTDCPAVTGQLIDKAFSFLETYDVVIGPAHDGGYYLIGTKRQIPDLFIGIPWSSENTLNATLSKCSTLGLSVMQLETLSDIDYAEDIHKFYPEWKHYFDKASHLSAEAEIWL